ncbi:MAG: type II toxin-antitoxin system ParD family antitoxin [Planctomycetota bacterium]|nr:type II toxin-antitoxin system ParD family antitoxin [Planctomycetota bacterium]
MSRQSTINVSLTERELRLVRARIHSGRYESASEVIRESLKVCSGILNLGSIHPTAN